jgi:outer membrane scaffolding protein for murein synthesis (MipA/OmpV family)
MRCWKLIASVLMGSVPQLDLAQTRQEPLWEYGLGIGAVTFQDYPGSDTSRVYPVPVGYLLYNGKFLKADRNGVRGLLLNQEWVELNVSAEISAPVRNDAVRNGMPELRPTLQLGPSVNFHLINSHADRFKLDLNLPVRAAFTIQGSPRDIGWVFEPQLKAQFKDAFGAQGWGVDLSSGPMFADERYHAYFYSVAPQYATAARPVYAAPGGYSGTQFGVTLKKRFAKLWFGAYLHYETLRGAVFLDSPLVQRNYDWSAGFGFAWILGKSKRLVEVPDWMPTPN